MLEQDVPPRIYFGYFGSSNTVLKSGLERDELEKTSKIIAFEIEEAGVWDIWPKIVIKAACDYADSYKSKEWQPYAAAVAAAELKAILQKLEIPDEIGSSTGRRICPSSMYNYAYKLADSANTFPNANVDRASSNANNLSNSTNHVFQGSTVYGGIHHYNDQFTGKRPN